MSTENTIIGIDLGTTLAGIALVAIGAVGGGVGALLAPKSAVRGDE